MYSVGHAKEGIGTNNSPKKIFITVILPTPGQCFYCVLVSPCPFAKGRGETNCVYNKTISPEKGP